MTPDLRCEPELDEHLRRTLRAVAATVGEPVTPARKRRPARRRALVGLGAAAIALPLAAGAILGIGPEYVDDLPPDHVVMAGRVDGTRYWMVESFHTDNCGDPATGVEIVAEDANILGREWSTVGVTYGDPEPLDAGDPCAYDVSTALADPALSYSSGVFVGDALLWVGAVHPDVTAVRATIDGAAQEVPVHLLDGAGYYVVEVPPDTTTYRVELLIGGEVVPGSKQTRTFPERDSR